MSVHATLTLSSLSIAWSLVLPLMLAVVTRQSHTHYFGMLTLPVLEAALFFSFATTLCIAAIASSISAFWVAYAAHFHPPFQLGELLEATTLVLVHFIIGGLVWWLVDLLSKREEELRERLRDLEITRSKLIEGEKLAAVGRLASAVAHEIRNPVAIISSALAASESEAFSAEDREEMSKVAVLESRRLEKLTSDFLSYAQPGSAPFVELDATAVVGYIASIVRAQALPKNLTIDLTTCDDCRIYGNEGQLQQVLLNLMRNAIEASPERAHIKISVGWHGREMIRIALENAGPPIPESAVFKIFEPFFTAKEGGTGLGLSIARSIIEKHEGKLLLERNEPDHIVFAAIVPASIPRSPSIEPSRKNLKEQWQEF
jgi:signal transduction histidine kinase